jgi:hypothetical protein
VALAFAIGCGGPGATTEIEGLAISPPTAAIDVGDTQVFIAQGVTDTGSLIDLSSEVEWTTDNAGIASIDLLGLATGHAPGTVTVTTTYDTFTAAAILTVRSATATLSSINVTSPATSVADGLTLQLDATGTYSDGSSRDVGDECTWSVNNALATISNAAGTKGLLTGQAAGAVDATCTIGTVNDAITINVGAAVLTSITISPDTNVSLPKGLTQQFTATGLFSDSTIPVDITETATWISLQPTIASISDVSPTKGLANGVLAGTVTVRATVGAIQDEVTFTISPAVLASLTISPDAPTIADGLTRQFTCDGLLSDGTPSDCTTLANWTSSNPAVASIGANTGLATTVGNTAIGQTIITATVGTISDTTQLNVTDSVIQSINIVPEPWTIPAGADLQFFTDVTFSDSSSCRVGTTCPGGIIVTWAASPAGRISILPSGLASSPNNATQGAATITATVGTFIDTSNGAVGAAVLESILVSPATHAFPLNQPFQFTATGTNTDDTQFDVTPLATWTSTFPAIASVSTITDRGIVTALTGGTTDILATYQGITGTASFTAETGPTEMDLFLAASPFASGGTENVGSGLAGTPIDRVFEIRNTGLSALRDHVPDAQQRVRRARRHAAPLRAAGAQRVHHDPGDAHRRRIVLRHREHREHRSQRQPEREPVHHQHHGHGDDAAGYPGRFRGCARLQHRLDADRR